MDAIQNSSNPEPDKVALNIQLDSSMNQMIESVKDDIGIKSKSDVVRILLIKGHEAYFREKNILASSLIS